MTSAPAPSWEGTAGRQPTGTGTEFEWTPPKPAVAPVEGHGRMVGSPFANAQPNFELSPPGAEKTAVSLDELKRMCKGMRLLSLFHGFSRPRDGIEHFA